MNINEFLALKVGDRISNPMSGTSGAVTGIVFDRRHQQEGVTLQWDGTAPDTARVFTKHTTAWMHWEREDAAVKRCTHGKTMSEYCGDCHESYGNGRQIA